MTSEPKPYGVKGMSTEERAMLDESLKTNLLCTGLSTSVIARVLSSQYNRTINKNMVIGMIQKMRDRGEYTAPKVYNTNHLTSERRRKQLRQPVLAKPTQGYDEGSIYCDTPHAVSPHDQATK